MIYIIVLLAVGFVIEIIFLCVIYSIDVHIRGVLKLLLHCQPKVIAETVKVMQVLNGNFKKNKCDNGTRTEKFYASVCGDLPDAIVTCSADQKIESTNKSFAHIFGEETTSQFENQPISEFLSTARFKGKVDSELGAQPQKPVTEELSFQPPGSESITNLEVTSTIINERLIIVFRDVNQTVCYNTLIKEEKQKSDRLLESNLPSFFGTSRSSR